VTLASAPAVQGAGVVIPAHNEQYRLAACLAAAAEAIRVVAGCPVRTVVVLDGCSDDSAVVVNGFAATWPGSFEVINQDQAGVGQARAAGFARLLTGWAAGAWGPADPGRLWLATTDADSQVPAGWLAYQLERAAEGHEAWAGTVRVDVDHSDGVSRDPAALARFVAAYAVGHPHYHGANLGMTARAYLAAGGFSGRPTGEDRAIIEALEAAGVAVSYDDGNPVLTSARRQARAPSGFAAALSRFGA
jgi:glycosyltransferase involved in cell wall biosynthesis